LRGQLFDLYARGRKSVSKFWIETASARCSSAVIVIVGGLTFLSALSLGPATEQLAMQSNHLY
jgi:K+-transporting ATPase A subunit